MVPHTSLKHYRKNIFINPLRNINKMLYNMLYIHFLRNIIDKTQINQLKIFRKCFVLPGYSKTYAFPTELTCQKPMSPSPILWESVVL